MNEPKHQFRLWIVMVVVLVVIFFAPGCTQPRGAFNDGSYQGTSAGYYGDITVEVLIRNGNIQEIKVLESEDTDGILAGVINVVIPDIIKAKGVDGVDILTGATGSSRGILGAVAKALVLATP